eukprot:6800406-Pyramimonas_sp.AAC.1
MDIGLLSLGGVDKPVGLDQPLRDGRSEARGFATDYLSPKDKAEGREGAPRRPRADPLLRRPRQSE